MKHVVIIGNGVSGISAARNVRKLNADHRITVISSETDYFYSRTALMYIYMGHMTLENTQPYENWFWEKNRIDLQRGHVHKLDTEAQELYLSQGQKVHYDDLVLAVGSAYNKFGWPGQDLPGVQGLVNYQDLQEMERNTKGVDHAVVVGGGLIGVEMSEMLHSRGIHVTFLVREERYMDYLLPAEEADMVGQEILSNGIDLRLGTELKEISAGPDGRVAKVETNKGDIIDCQFVGLTAGVHPNIDLIKDSPIELGRGIKINRNFRTNIPNVYAIGDCAEFLEPLPGRRPIEQLWYTGREHGEVVAKNICGQETEYSPGVFYNSAKFFDLEYQTYGDIRAQLPEDQESLFWQDDEGKHSIRITYERANQKVVGFNVFGIRYRQDQCTKWISSGAR